MNSNFNGSTKNNQSFNKPTKVKDIALGFLIVYLKRDCLPESSVGLIHLL